MTEKKICRLSVKDGVVFRNFRIEMIKLLDMLNCYANERRINLVITSATDGNHKPRSKHPKGYAYDIRSRNLCYKEIKFLGLFIERISTGYDYVIEFYCRDCGRMSYFSYKDKTPLADLKCQHCNGSVLLKHHIHIEWDPKEIQDFIIRSDYKTALKKTIIKELEESNDK